MATATLEAAFNRLFSRRKEEKLTLQEQFDAEIVRPFSENKEVDVDELEKWYEVLNFYASKWWPYIKDPAIGQDGLLEQDVDVRAQKRLEFLVVSRKNRMDLFARLEVAKQREGELAVVEAKQRALIDEKNKWWEDFNARAQPIDARVKELQTALLGENSVSLCQKLKDTTLHPGILEKRAKLRSRRSEIAPEIRELTETQGTIYLGDYHERKIAEAKQDLANFKSNETWNSRQTAKDLQETIARHVKELEVLEFGSGLSGKRKRLAELQAESKDIEKQLNQLDEDALKA